ncbi:hypothetical protein HJG60_009984 [Phyllostomus discolor]|uniref:Uncharacterized protein n=1 Tax=Phyllostomus discolor TaxID=89673 RepID=A0A834EQP2_9CHIR|nr:hypothetical protein HJG60_009984 [Phyllostomus discolor]
MTGNWLPPDFSQRKKEKTLTRRSFTSDTNTRLKSILIPVTEKSQGALFEDNLLLELTSGNFSPSRPFRTDAEGEETLQTAECLCVQPKPTARSEALGEEKGQNKELTLRTGGRFEKVGVQRESVPGGTEQWLKIHSGLLRSRLAPGSSSERKLQPLDSKPWMSKPDFANWTF